MKSILGSLAFLALASLAAGCSDSAEEETSFDPLTGWEVDPSVSSPAAWGCNLSDGSSVVFVQERVHSAYGTVSTYPAHIDSRAPFGTLSTGGGQEATSTTPAKFGGEAGRTIDLKDRASGELIAHIVIGEQYQIPPTIYRATGTMKDLKGGCWGVR